METLATSKLTELLNSVPDLRDARVSRTFSTPAWRAQLTGFRRYSPTNTGTTMSWIGEGDTPEEALQAAAEARQAKVTRYEADTNRSWTGWVDTDVLRQG